jgi:hypothetical protein
MTFPLGKTLAAYLAGINFSGASNGYDTDLSIEALDVTCFGSSYHKTQVAGLLDADLSLKGFYTHTVDPDASGTANVLAAAARTATPGLVCLPGSGTTPAAGDLADLWIAATVSRTIGAEPGGVVTLDADLKTTTGLHAGTVLVAEGAQAGSPFSTTGYDQGGGSWVSDTYTYLVIVQVTAYTSGLAALLVQTSTDNSTYTTRGTFPAITGVGGYALALTATLDRYIRLRDTGNATLIAGVALTY